MQEYARAFTHGGIRVMNDIIDFFYLVSNIKELPRSGWIARNIDPPIESTGSHTFGVLFLTWLFSKKENIDTDKVLKMALVHDLLESITGDFLPGDVGKMERDKVENQALEKIRHKIPEEIRDDIISLIIEFNEGVSKESKIVKICDKLDSVLQALFYYKDNRTNITTLNNFLESASVINSNQHAKELLMLVTLARARELGLSVE